jgi:hypothetical protein
VKPLDLLAASCDHPEYVGEVGVIGEDGSERVRVVDVPRMEHGGDDLVGGLFGLG